MANKVLDGIISIDSTGGVVGAATRLMIAGVQVVANNSTWAVILKDAAGNVVYQANNTASVGQLTKPFPSNGLVADTLTNITVLLVYLG
jgi:hypothetical protein